MNACETYYLNPCGSVKVDHIARFQRTDRLTTLTNQQPTDLHLSFPLKLDVGVKLCLYSIDV